MLKLDVVPVLGTVRGIFLQFGFALLHELRKSGSALSEEQKHTYAYLQSLRAALAAVDVASVKDLPPYKTTEEVIIHPDVLADMARGAVVYYGAGDKLLDDRVYLREIIKARN